MVPSFRPRPTLIALSLFAWMAHAPAALAMPVLDRKSVV